MLSIFSVFPASVAFRHAEVYNNITAHLVTVEYFTAVSCCAQSLQSMVYNNPFVVQKQQVCVRLHVSADCQGCYTEPTTRQSLAKHVLPAYKETIGNF